MTRLANQAKWIRHILVLGSILMTSSMLAAPVATGETVIDLRGQDLSQRGGVQLDGPWAFYWGRFIRPGQRPNVAPTAMVRLPQKFHEHSVPGARLPGVGHASYRIVLKLPPNTGSLALRARNTVSAVRIYWDGKLMGGSGRVSTSQAGAFAVERPLLLAPIQPAADGRAEIVVHVSNYHHARGAPGQYILQTEKPARFERDGRRALDAFVVGALALIALYHLALFFARREDRAALWFAVFCAGITVRAVVMNEQILNHGAFPFWVKIHTEYLGWFAAIASFPLFLFHLYPTESSRRITHGFVATGVALCVVVLVLPPVWFSETQPSAQYLTLAGCAYSLFVVVRAAIRKRKGAYFMLPGWGVLFLCIFLDIYRPGIVPMGPTYVTPLGLVAFIFAQAGVLAGNFAAAYRTADRLRNELEQLNSVKDRFLANLSHELKTPLTAIYGYSEMLEDAANIESARTMGGRIRSGAEALSQQLNDLFLLSRLESEGEESQREVLNLSQTVQSALDELKSVAAEQNVTLKGDLVSGLTVKGDSEQLERSIVNVLRNAVLYNRIDGSVHVRTHQEGDAVLVEVRDTGVGIPATDLPRVFDRFYRGDSSDTYAVTGVGLGLFVSRSIIENHGGSIEIESEEGHGTVVTIRLPGAVQAPAASPALG